jgi:hypothetical protein
MGAARDVRVYDDPQVPLKSQSGQMSIRRPTGHLKMSIWSNEHTTTNMYTTTYRNSWKCQSVKWIYDDLQVPYQLNLVKWEYDDLHVPLKRQSGKMGIYRGPETLQNRQSSLMRIRWPTGSLETLIWSNAYTTTYRNP